MLDVVLDREVSYKEMARTYEPSTDFYEEEYGLDEEDGDYEDEDDDDDDEQQDILLAMLDSLGYRREDADDDDFDD